VPYQLITDMAASLMGKGQVDAIWVGQTDCR
jgi:methylthioribose-1-phosphate isomerase